METRLYLAYLARGELKDYYHETINDLCDRYNLVELREKERLAHMTVKAPFLSEDIEGVERIVDGLAKIEEEILLEVYGIGHFDDKVAYIGADTNYKGRNYIQKIIDEFKAGKFDMSRYDHGDKRLHITFAKKKESGGRFDEVVAYLKENERSFIVPLDNLTLMGKNRGKSGIYKIFEMH